jgi:hypothetical protein
MKKEFIFGPTARDCERYCKLHGLDPDDYVIIDLETPWYVAVRRLVSEVERNHIKVLDSEYSDGVIFNDIMSYIDLTGIITMEIVDYVRRS